MAIRRWRRGGKMQKAVHQYSTREVAIAYARRYVGGGRQRRLLRSAGRGRQPRLPAHGGRHGKLRARPGRGLTKKGDV